jgi:hypothetical protein
MPNGGWTAGDVDVVKAADILDRSADIEIYPREGRGEIAGRASCVGPHENIRCDNGLLRRERASSRTSQTRNGTVTG